MGTVHKFKRPPKNEGQFRGYRPRPQGFGDGKHPRRAWPAWLRSAIAWLVIVLAAVGFWAIGKLTHGG